MNPPTYYSKCHICSIVKLKRMARIWLSLITRTNKHRRPDQLPSDVPPGHVAVLVGEASRRFVIRADFLNLPVFRQLLDCAYEEYGHEQQCGPLAIPCDEFLFCDVVSKIDKGFVFSQLISCHDSVVVGGDSTSLLHQGSAY